MRRAALLLIAVLLLPLPASASGAAQACTQKAATAAGVKALILCAAPRLGVSTSKALAIAWRESRYQPRAHNPSSSACGAFQVVSGTWRYFVGRYVYGHSLGVLSCENGRANVFLSLRAVRHGGWSPWGG